MDNLKVYWLIFLTLFLGFVAVSFVFASKEIKGKNGWCNLTSAYGTSVNARVFGSPVVDPEVGFPYDAYKYYNKVYRHCKTLYIRTYWGWECAHSNYSFEFYYPRLIWVVNRSEKIPWAFEFELMVAGIDINSNDPKSMENQVSFILLSDGKIVDCWIQNVSQVHQLNCTIPACSGLVILNTTLYVHVSKICLDANCAYVEVWSGPIPLHANIYVIEGREYIEGSKGPLYSLPDSWLERDVSCVDTFIADMGTFKRVIRIFWLSTGRLYTPTGYPSCVKAKC